VAENRVEIVVKSRNETKAGYDAAKRDAEVAGEDAANSFSNRFGQDLTASAGGGGAGGGGMFSGLLAAAGPWGIAIGIAMAAAMVPALLGGLATLGLGAAGIFAAFHFDKKAPFVKQFKDTFDDIGKSVGHTFAPVLNQLAGFFQQIAPLIKQLFSAAEPGFMAFLKALEPSIKQVLPYLTQFVKAFAPFAGQLGRAVGQFLVLVVKGLQYLEPAFKASASFIQGFVNFVGGLFDFLARLIGDVVRIIADLIQGKWSDAWKYAKDLVHYAFTGIQQLITNFLVWIGPTLSKLIHGIIHWFAQLPDVFFNLGKDILLGLLHGLESIGKSVLSYVENLGSSIGSVFSSILHMASPSKVFEEHGRNIVRGLVHGIDMEAPSALRAIGRIGGSLGLAGVGGYGGGVQLVVSGVGAPDWYRITKMIWPAFQLEVRHRGGGGVYSAQKALGQTWPGR